MVTDNKKKRGWIILCILFGAMSVISFTPWVIPMERYEPRLFGVPYTLWVGFSVAVFFVILTYLGTRYFPGTEHEEEV